MAPASRAARRGSRSTVRGALASGERATRSRCRRPPPRRRRRRRARAPPPTSAAGFALLTAGSRRRLPLVPPPPARGVAPLPFRRWTSRPRSAAGGPTRPSGRTRCRREVLGELFDLARWAPNHNLTNPWRFRVLGPRALERLKRAAGSGGGVEARPGADPGRLLVCPRRRSGAGRGGPPRDRLRRLHRAARRPRARAGRLLADPRGPAHRRRARRGRAARERALRQPDPPRRADPGEGRPRARTRSPTPSSTSI